MSKYNNKKKDGFDSKMEYEFKSLLENLGIEHETQKVYVLQESYQLNGSKVREIKYVADFYLPKLDLVIDVKGFSTADFKLKKKLFEQKFNKELLLLTKCPKCYLDKNKDAYFEGWIETKLLDKLKKERKKTLPKKEVEKVRLPIGKGVNVSKNKVMDLLLFLLDCSTNENDIVKIKNKIGGYYLINKI